MRKTRVLVAVGRRLGNQLFGFLRGLPPVEVVGEAQDTEEAIDLARRCRPEVVLLELPALLQGEGKGRPGEPKSARTTVLAVRVAGEGRRGVPSIQVLKCAVPPDEVSLQEFRIALGIPSIRRSNAGRKKIEGLSNREREVLELLAEGNSTKEVGTVLGISPKTVEIHRLHIKAKLDLRNTAEMVRYAIKTGLVQL